MTDTKVVIIKQKNLPEISVLKKGSQTNYEYSGTGRWSHDKIAMVLLIMPPGEWLSIEKLARCAFGSATPSNQKKARERISRLWHYIFRFHGRVMIKEYERKQKDIRIVGRLLKRRTELKGRSTISRVKLAEFTDKELAVSELTERRRHNEITKHQLEQMIDSLNQLAPPNYDDSANGVGDVS